MGGVEVASAEAEREIERAAGGGAPLSDPLRGFFESRLNRDLGHVRIHADPLAEAACRNLGAAAFSVGSSVFFGRQQYSPETAPGRGLIAHELAHVLQQGRGAAPRMIQRAVIPYQPITWANFHAAPAPGPGSREGAGILSRFEPVPSYSPKTDARLKPGRRPCTLEGKRNVEYLGSAKPDPDGLKYPLAVMDEDASWALPRYTGDGKAYCAGETAKCEADVAQLPADVRRQCEQSRNQCRLEFDQGKNSFGLQIGANRLTVTRMADCSTTLFQRCQEWTLRVASVSAHGVQARAKADCSGVFVQNCLADEVIERARLLRHEQGHFDITNVMAKNTRDSVQAVAASKSVDATGCGNDGARDAARTQYDSTIRPALQALYNDWRSAKDRAQQAYDDQTVHGANAAKQSEWERKITAGLIDFAPPPPTAPVTPNPPGRGLSADAD